MSDAERSGHTAADYNELCLMDETFFNWCLGCIVCYRSPAEGGVCVQRSGVSVLPESFAAAADAAVGGGDRAPELVGAANRIWTG